MGCSCGISSVGLLFLIARESVVFMKIPVLFYGSILVAVVALAFAVYYIIPGIYHPLTTTPPLASHPTHAVAFFRPALHAVVAALGHRPRPTRRMSRTLTP